MPVIRPLYCGWQLSRNPNRVAIYSYSVVFKRCFGISRLFHFPLRHGRPLAWKVDDHLCSRGQRLLLGRQPLRVLNSTAIKETEKSVRNRIDLTASRGLKRLLALAEDEKWRLAGGIVLLIISSAVTMAVPFSMGKVIDIIYTGSEDSPEMNKNLTTVARLLLCIFILGATANFGRVYLMQTTGYRITQKLRVQVFSSILRQEMAFFDRHKTGELINRLSADASLVGNSLSHSISDSMRSSIAVVAGIVMMFYTSAELALVGLATVPPLAGITIIYGRYVKKITTRVQDALAQTTQLAEERISNLRTVRTFAQEGREGEQYKTQAYRVLELMKKESLAKGLFFGATGLSGNVIVLSVLYYGGLMMTDSQITMGDLSAFLLYAAYVGVSFGGLSSAYSETMKGLGAGTRLWEIVDRNPIISLTEGRVPPGRELIGNIEFREVCFRYPSRPEFPIFRNLNLTVPSGRVTAIVGSSGSGKSTLAHLLLRFYDPDAGGIFIDGMDISTLSPEWIRTTIGTVAQEPILFSCSVRENILYGGRNAQAISTDQLESVCREANAYEFIQRFPEKFETIVGERGVMLSGGQRQRLAIARAILKVRIAIVKKNPASGSIHLNRASEENPKILLLDEATSALDAESEYLVREALERLMKDRTVITIAHRLSTIKMASQIVVLEEGRIAEVGSYDFLMTISNGLFKKLVERQTIATDK